MPETSENCDGRIDEEIACENWISALPDDLLVTILKSIPIKDAVATMILSKRWRFIWTMLPVLEYKESDDERKRSVWLFLDNSLQHHKAPVLDILCMELGPQCPPDADVGKWIAKAVKRRVAILELKLLWSADPTSLPTTLYSCESLKLLNLSHKILVDVPCHACLPSLEILNLDSVVYKNEDSVIRLLSGCPILDFMYVKRGKDDNVKNFCLKSPYLLRLTYINLHSYGDTGRCLVIDTPVLTELTIIGNSGEPCSIEVTMPCCEELVVIELDPPFTHINKFLRSFPAVLSLELVLTEEMIVSCSNIKFSRLTKCKMYPCDSDWMDSLVSFLQNTPKLKLFIVDYEFTYQPPDASISWMESSYDPECLSSSLEEFELIGYGGREEEKDLVDYILTTSRCLKTATISLKLDQDKDAITEELNAIPRVSITSQIFVQNLDILT